MTAREAIAYIENQGWSKTRLGLGRTRELLEMLGEPHKSLRFVHVAGSNGKGSVCAMLDSILRAAGYKTGLFTSPYIQDFCERIRVNSENIDGNALAEITERVKCAAESMDDHPSQFELVTAAAMLYFCESACDIVVLEVGMGGEFDATNVIDAPELAVITNIGLEHTEYLGDTIEKIARTKAGIIKEGSFCVCYDGAEEATAVIREVCEARGVPLYCADFSNLRLISSGLYRQEIEWSGEKYSLGLIGEHQLHNAALVLTGVEALRERGWNIPAEAVRLGLASAKWRARLEVLNTAPLFILDGGHNPQCAQALAKSLGTLLGGRRAVMLVGVLADKDYAEIVRLIAPLASEFICVEPNSDRRLPAEELRRHIEDKGLCATACESIEDGIFTAIERAGTDGCAVAFGSLYMAGEVLSRFGSAYRRWLRKDRVAAREALSPDEREALSARIVENIASSELFRRAKTVLIYAAARAEASLDTITDMPEARGKIFCYPYCVTDTEMTALAPENEGALENGRFGIREPIRELSREISPEDIDLVICPCAAFDGNGGRLGMGAGFYDRYLPKCKNARVCAAAFEAQRADAIPLEPWDVPMDAVFTEKGGYYRKDRQNAD